MGRRKTVGPQRPGECCTRPHTKQVLGIVPGAGVIWSGERGRPCGGALPVLLLRTAGDTNGPDQRAPGHQG